LFFLKACILQRAADHIKSLENEKVKLQSQNEQFRILIKSFQIDSTSVLQGQRRLSTNGKFFCLLLRLENRKKPRLLLLLMTVSYPLTFKGN
jgi:hypothetical protein